MKTRCFTWRIVQMFMLVAPLALGATPALAVHDDGVFQIDGDVLHNPTGSGDDWQDLFTCTASGCVSSGLGAAVARSWVGDPAPGSIFTGGGSKDQIDISQWRWKDGSVPDKDDLTSGFAARYNGTDPRLYFGADRLANNGDAQIGTWFFQTSIFLCGGTGPNGVPAGTGGCVAGTFVTQSGALAHQQVGNILILSNFTNGGGTSNIAAYVVTAFVPDGAVSLQLIAGGGGPGNLSCDGNDDLCAATNAADTPALGAYYVPKFGTAGTYPNESIFEGGLALQPFGLQFECFGSFLDETRSSQSITAVLKDFVLGGFEQCSAAIVTHVRDDNNPDSDLTGSTNVAAGTSVHDEAVVTGTSGVPAPTGTVTFEFFDSLTCDTSSVVATENGTLSDAVPATDPPTAIATSPSRTPPPGEHSYHAKYNGDFRYPATGFSACEPFTVTRVASSATTTIVIDGLAGDVTNTALDSSAGNVNVRDKATVTCSGFTATGGVTFTFFSNDTCSGTGTVDNCGQAGGCPVTGGVATSGVHAVNSGVFSFNAVYNGDDNCLPSSTSSCEPVCALDFLHTTP